jgi:hypothetical protein
MNAQTYSGKVGFNRASRRNPCPICGAKKYCGVTRDGRLAHCMYVDTGSIKIAKDGGYLHLLIDDRCDLTQISKQQHIKKQVTSELSTLAPLEVRHAVYSRLIELSPSWKYEAELIQGMDGLLRRGLTSEDIVKFGALPPTISERDQLATELSKYVELKFSSYSKEKNYSPVLGVPGFWEGNNGQPKLGKNYNYKGPSLIIPYISSDGFIQACQIRFKNSEGKSSYIWLSTAADNVDKEPRGTSSGSPLHFSFLPNEPYPNLPIIVTEGRLKADVFARLRPGWRLIATAGIGNSHQEIIIACRGRNILLGFDSDYIENVKVCKQLAKLIALRILDTREHSTHNPSTEILDWEGSKGLDDAALAQSHIKNISINDWWKNLSPEPKTRIQETWRDISFKF